MTLFCTGILQLLLLPTIIFTNEVFMDDYIFYWNFADVTVLGV